MPGTVSSALRLVAAGWVLVRHDALVPREVAPLLPPLPRFAAAALRLVSGPYARRGRPGERLARAFEALGPVAIKLGQLLSTRADIFGGQFADDLGRLKDRLAPFPRERAIQEVEASLGRPLGGLFVTFGEPVAAASLAQAHPADLADGRKVAVKVLRPKIERRVAADLGAMRLSARLVEAFAPPLRRLQPKAFVATVARSMELELDMRLEAAAASEMAEVMARDSYIRAPGVVWEGVGKRVLTLEWSPGAPLSDPATLETPGLDRPALATNVTRGFLAQALDHGVFHADLHEGNLFAEAPDRLYAVDFGIVGRIGPKERRFLAEILWGFLRRDYRRIAEVHFEAGYVSPEHGVDAFAQALRAVGEPIVGRPAGEVSMGRLLGQLFEITGLFDMQMRPELVLLQKTMVTVEGVARRIDPDHDIWAAARPVVERWIGRELSPVSRIRELIATGQKAFDSLARLADAPAATTVIVKPAGGRLALTLAVAAVAAALAALAVSLGLRF